MDTFPMDERSGFLQENGYIPAYFQQIKWTETSLGHPATWPQSLVTAAGIVLQSPVPMMLWWGSELVQVYNKPFTPLAAQLAGGENLLAAEGAGRRDEAWKGMQKMISRVMAENKAITQNTQAVRVARHGQQQSILYTLNYTPILAETGSAGGVLLTCLEEQQQLPDESRQQILTMFEQSPVAIATLSATDELTFLSSNPFYAELVGRQPDQIVNKPLLEALPEIAGQGFDKLLKNVIATGEPFIADELGVQLVRNGLLETIYVNLTYQPYRDHGGAVTGVLVVAADVTQQVNSRRKIEASEGRLKGLIAAAPAGIGLFVGRDLIIENPNQTFIDIVGKGPGITGLPLREAMPELITEGQAYLKILDDVFTTGVPFISPASLVKIVQDGVLNSNYYNISYTPLRDGNGEIYAILDIAIDVTEQVKAQQGLAASEAHLQLLRDTVPAMIFYLDAGQRYQSYNVVFREWFNVDETGAIGKTVREFIGDTAYAVTKPHLDKAYAGEQERYEMFAPSRMTTGRWLSIVYTPHKNPDGSVAGVIVHATDITQSKQTEMALRNSERRFRSLIEEAPVATCLFTGPEMKIALANELMISFWGKDSSVINKPLLEALPEIASQPFMDILKHVMATGETYEAKSAPAMLEVNGVLSTFYFDFTYKPLRDAAGDIYGIMNMAVDVTSQVLSRQKLQEKEIDLRNAVELAQLGTWSVNLADGMLTLSERHAAMMGMPGTEVHFKTALTVVDPADVGTLRAAFNASALNEPGTFEAEYRITNPKTGKQHVLHAIGQLYKNETGKPVRIAGTVQDMTIQRNLQLTLINEVRQRTEELAASNNRLQTINTQLEELNSALTRSNEELAQYAYVASHDLQEPLRKIRVFTDMVNNDKTLQDKTRIATEKISRSAERMSLLIGDLLEFSRLLNADTLLQRVDLSKVVTAVCGDFELKISEMNASIQLSGLPVIHAVGLQMNQLFYNLISNALKFAAPGRPVQLVISSRQMTQDEILVYTPKPLAANYYHISVSDNGIGFEDKYHDQIFEVFKRLHNRENYAGSGIGLAMCKRIVSNHQGFIHAESEAGQGSVFHVILPEVQAPRH